MAPKPEYIPYSNLDNLMVAEQVAARLRPDLPPDKGLQWVRGKVRRCCPNPMPVRNVGRHLLFDSVLVADWIANSPPTTRHSPHPRRRKKVEV